MKFLGLDIQFSSRATKDATGALQPIGSYGSGGGWFNIAVREPFTGAWQRGLSLRAENVVAFSAVYACVTLIASDIGKMCMRLVEKDSHGIWKEVSSASFSPVLRKPNRYQNRIKFWENWITSKLLHGNTYVLKERDNRNVVVGLYILDPHKVTPLVASDGSVWYKLSRDNLAGVEDEVVVPASEIIHDTMVCLYHPLCGVSPITACGLAASQGMNIQKNSNRFFQNNSKPGGILSAPGRIEDADVARLKEYWEDNFSGENIGKIAVLGSNMKFESMTVNAVDAQLIEQLKWSAETVCSTFHVPPYMIGVGVMPFYNNIEALNQQYYSQCLQALIESAELCMDEGLGLDTQKDHTYGTEFDLDGLLRMDTATMIKTEADAVKGGVKSPNESRARLNLGPVAGGDTPYLQQQNFSLAALEKRDNSADPFKTSSPAPPVAPHSETPPAKRFDVIDDAAIAQFSAWTFKSLLAA